MIDNLKYQQTKDMQPKPRSAAFARLNLRIALFNTYMQLFPEQQHLTIAEFEKEIDQSMVINQPPETPNHEMTQEKTNKIIKTILLPVFKENMERFKDGE